MKIYGVTYAREGLPPDFDLEGERKKVMNHFKNEKIKAAIAVAYIDVTPFKISFIFKSTVQVDDES